MSRLSLRKHLGGAAATPLLVLFGLNFVDEFDRIAFAALAPELQRAFDLSDTGIGAIGVIAGVFVLLVALPIGWAADRLPRLRLALVAALLWGTMSVLTGLVPTVGLLILVRILSGAGRITNEVVHPSLLGDYYEPRVLPRVFQVHRAATPMGAVSGVVAGYIAGAAGWQWAFIVLAVPTFLLLLALSRLREPLRGHTVDAAEAARAQADPPVPFGEARRRLAAIRTLKRLWTAAFFLGIGGISIQLFISLFFENVYGYGPQGRGWVQFLFGAGTVVGLFAGGALAAKAMTREDQPRLAFLTGAWGATFFGGLLLMAIAPWPALSLLGVVLLATGAGGYQPAYFPLVGLVAPPRIRSQAYAWAILFVGSGGLASIMLFALAEASGYRTAMGLLAFITAVASVIAMSAARFVRRDIEQAAQALGAAHRLREEFAATGAQALLVCRGVEVAYDQVQVLFGVDLEVHAGECVALLGTNGAGKSTLLRAISGTHDPSGGVIFFDGRDITHADANQTATLGIAQVPGGKAVFPTLTVGEHLRAAGWLYRGDKAYLTQAVREVYATFPRLKEREHQLAGDLSGGEQQMLGLGMAFIAKPKLLMIDELSLGLAPAIVEQLLKILRRIQDSGTAIVLVEQSVNVALTVAERAYFLEKGEVRFSGPTADLLARPDVLRSVFLEGAATRGVVSCEPQGFITHHTPGSDRAEVVLEVTGLTKRFGGIRAVDDAAFTLREGEILGLIGPNGAGKTTIFDLVSGFLSPDGGRIELAGQDITRLAADKRAWLGLGRSFQDARLVPSLTVAENLALGLERHLGIRDHVAAALSLPMMLRQEEDVAWTVADLVELMGLDAYRDKFVRELSTGTRRIVDLAMCIAHEPSVLLLDEPSSGIAQRETEALGPLLRRIQSETGCALLVIEHDMPLITSISDRMIALDLGHPIAEGTPAEVVRDPRVVASYLGGGGVAAQRSGEPVAAHATQGGES